MSQLTLAATGAGFACDGDRTGWRRLVAMSGLWGRAVPFPQLEQNRLVRFEPFARFLSPETKPAIDKNRPDLLQRETFPEAKTENRMNQAGRFWNRRRGL